MAEIAVKFLLDKLAPLFENDLQLLRGVRQEVMYLRGELERTMAVLKLADALEDGDEELRVWVKQVRDIAHDTEDILDEFTLLHAHHHHRETEGLYGSFHRFSCCIKNTKARYRVASELRAINERIAKVCEARKRLKHKLRLASDAAVGLGSEESGGVWECCRGKALLLEKSDVVGIEGPKRRLVGWLVGGGTGREVVAVTAMGGMGKTTLAKQVYDAAQVKRRFEISAWITVSQSFKLDEVLRELVRQVFGVIRRPVPDDVDRMSNYQLKKMIKDLLAKRKYLIVLDDVWHLYEWDALKYALPSNNRGSRVVITTRNTEVASTTSLETDGKVYNLEPLPMPESWDLLCSKSFRGQSCCPPHLVGICEYILRKCEGLPLAIVAIGGVLATKDARRIDEWEMVGHSLGAEIEGNDKLKDLKKVLSLSFNDLPYYLKSCFLYLGVFPEDKLVEHMRLIRLWIAEGFIEAKDGKTLEDVAEGYLNELLNRSMLQAAVTRSDGRVKSFRVHDLLREIIVAKSRDQNFATILKEKAAPLPDKIRRLSVHNTLQNLQDRSVSQLRSLFMFGIDERPSINALFPPGLRLLNVLDLRNVPLVKFPIEIVSLYFLKYLSLRNTKVKVIPGLIGKLQNLETLDLKHARVTELPSEIVKLQRLRHLLAYRYEYVSYGHFHSKYGFKLAAKFGALRSLQNLCFVEVDRDNVSELGKLDQLRRLGITKLRKEDGKALCASIENLTKLCALSVTSVEEDELVDLHRLSAPPLLLQRLYLRGRLETLPLWIPSLHCLAILYLKWSKLKDDPVVFLQGLPNLVHLELCQAFEGKALRFGAGGFRKLKHLGLDEFNELKYVHFDAGAMPRVKKLSIQRCPLLEKVPTGIEHLASLKVLEFFDMPEELIKNAQGVDYWRVAHIPEVYSTYWREGGWEVYSLDRLAIDGENAPWPSSIIKSHELESRWK